MTKDSPATWIKAIAIWLFLAFWVSGMVTGLAASSCRKDHKEPSRKLAACNISLTVGAPLDSGEHARAKRSFLHLERGIALVQLQRLPEAESAFATAYRNAKGSTGPWLQNLHDQMASRPSDQATLLWVKVTERWHP